MGVRLTRAKGEDVVGATMTEIVMFLLFSCLILLGGYMAPHDQGGHGQPSPVPLPGQLGTSSPNIGVSLGGGANSQNPNFTAGGTSPSNSLSTPSSMTDPDAQVFLQPDWPYIITLSDQNGYRFNTGDASLSERFGNLLITEALPELFQMVQNSPKSDIVIEVVGHTDADPVSSPHTANLDLLPAAFADRDQIMHHHDNVGLGMSRAISVARRLEDLAQRPGNEWLHNILILPMSAGPMVMVNGDRATGEERPLVDRSRRRIEVRVRMRNPRQLALAE